MTLYTAVQRGSIKAGIPHAARLRRWAGRAYDQVSGNDAEVTIRVVDEQEGAALNRRYRGKRSATNVLSFPCSTPVKTARKLLGDIVICAPVVARQAAESGRPRDAHWAHMVVHGMLHLCGYDHDRTMTARAMEKMETRILKDLGFGSPYE